MVLNLRRWLVVEAVTLNAMDAQSVEPRLQQIVLPSLWATCEPSDDNTTYLTLEADAPSLLLRCQSIHQPHRTSQEDGHRRRQEGAHRAIAARRVGLSSFFFS